MKIIKIYGSKGRKLIKCIDDTMNEIVNKNNTNLYQQGEKYNIILKPNTNMEEMLIL